MAEKKWIKGAIEKPGALRAAAKAAGALKDDGTISREWLIKMSRKGGKMGRRARLAMTLGKLKK